MSEILFFYVGFNQFNGHVNFLHGFILLCAEKILNGHRTSSTHFSNYQVGLNLFIFYEFSNHLRIAGRR